LFINVPYNELLNLVNDIISSAAFAAVGISSAAFAAVG